MKKILPLLCSILGLTLFAGISQAQTGATTPYRVDYFANANTGGAPDATLRLDNDGAAIGNVCADIFVFDTNEEMSECCSCLETPDGLRTLSVDADLTANPLTGATLVNGVIKIVAAAPVNDTCPPPSTITLLTNGEIQAWATHIQSSSNTVTETPSQVSYLSATEKSRLAAGCGSIRAIGSGHGLCTCGTGTGS
jgi:hypothetical protein